MTAKITDFLRVDFIKDWIDNLRGRLKSEFGLDPSKIPDDRIAVTYWHAVQRRISPRPRAINVANQFSCPPSKQRGWEAVKAEIVAGADLTPRLSGRIAKLNSRDRMLADWGIQHLHLGEIPEDHDDPIIFAMVTDDVFYAINVYTHDDWTNVGVLEIIHQNWPQLLQHAVVRGITGDSLTAEERLAIRSKNCNVAVQVSDGTVYVCIGGGLVASGDNIRAWLDHDGYMHQLEQYQQRLFDWLPAIEQLLKANGYDGCSELRATLFASPFFYYGNFQDYGVMVNLGLRPDVTAEQLKRMTEC